MPFPCPSWKNAWCCAQIDHVGQPGLAEPAGDFLRCVPRQEPGGVPVERVAHADLGIGMHRDADRRHVQRDAQAFHNPPSARHQPPLETAERRNRPAQSSAVLAALRRNGVVFMIALKVLVYIIWCVAAVEKWSGVCGLVWRISQWSRIVMVDEARDMAKSSASWILLLL